MTFLIPKRLKVTLLTSQRLEMTLLISNCLKMIFLISNMLRVFSQDHWFGSTPLRIERLWKLRVWGSGCPLDMTALTAESVIWGERHVQFAVHRGLSSCWRWVLCTGLLKRQGLLNRLLISTGHGMLKSTGHGMLKSTQVANQ